MITYAASAPKIHGSSELTDATIVYLDSYRYGDELIEKLAEAMK